jgi:diadenosine tetraphosphate (Ap4A) HIT family hydrolase
VLARDDRAAVATDAHLTGCALCRAVASEPPLFADARWHVRHLEPPWGVAGWIMVVSRRHVDGLGALDDDEARALGPALRHCARLLGEVTGAPRIYTAALGEAVPHFHAHLVPRRDGGPRGWSLFDTQRAAAAGELVVDPDEVARVSAALAARLRAEPLP